MGSRRTAPRRRRRRARRPRSRCSPQVGERRRRHRSCGGRNGCPCPRRRSGRRGLDEHRADEALGRLLGELGRELQHEQAVDAGGREEVVAHRPGGDELGGARSGRRTATGCGSKVTATEGRPSRWPASARDASTARCPLWTPSKLPRVRTQGRRASGVPDGSVQRCTGTLYELAGENTTWLRAVGPASSSMATRVPSGAIAATGSARPGTADAMRCPNPRVRASASSTSRTAKAARAASASGSDGHRRPPWRLEVGRAGARRRGENRPTRVRRSTVRWPPHAERRAEVAGQRADVGARGDVDRDVDVRTAPCRRPARPHARRRRTGSRSPAARRSSTSSPARTRA